jgi:hypothetical protein
VFEDVPVYPDAWSMAVSMTISTLSGERHEPGEPPPQPHRVVRWNHRSCLGKAGNVYSQLSGTAFLTLTRYIEDWTVLSNEESLSLRKNRIRIESYV